MNRSLFLTALSAKALYAKIRENFAKEVVVAICAGVIFLLFFYIFNDFLNVEIADLSTKMQTFFGSWTAWVLALLVGIKLGRIIKVEYVQSPSFTITSRYLGESAKIIADFLKLRTLIIVLLCSAFFYLLVFHYLWQTSIPQKIGVHTILYVVTFLSFTFSYQSETKNQDMWQTILPSRKLTAMQNFVLWRIKLFLTRNRLAQITMFFSFAFAMVSIFCVYRQTPLFVAILASMLAGLSLVAGVAYQVADDLQYSWVEKNLGISHDFYVMGLLNFCGVLAVSLGGLILILAMVINQIYPFTDVLKLVVVSMIPLWALPFMIFQIDGRKPLIQIIVLILATLFLSTAVLAHWLSIVIVPVVMAYGKQSQQNHFYRV